ncbi:MAG TPA: M90 family metallopeptidase [Ramlibacter sp.]|nr:M90 family metallopeptidase [Ramlibacter sp.]
MFGWLRKRPAAREIPDALWHEVLAQFPFLAHRDAAEVQRLRELAGQFLAKKEFTGASGFVITDGVAVAIAAQAVLPVLHLGLSWYDDFVGIVVHGDEVVARRTSVDDTGVVHDWEEVISGEAMDRGPVMLSWSDVSSAGERAHEGYNVVIHEFTHKIDMRDGKPDGCPPLPSLAARKSWLEVMQREYEAFREKVIVAERFGGEEPWLDSYGAQSIDEFFAVASEAYFVAPGRFREGHAALAVLFDGFFLGPNASRP